MYNFNYHRPSSVADAIKALAGGDEARPLAGGMTLLPTMKQRLSQPSDLVDLSQIAELQGIKASGSGLVIGAMTCHADVARSAEVKSTIAAIAALAEGIGDPQVRHCGTIGGSLANNDPAADYPGAVLGLGATIHTNKRKIAGDDFFKGMFETALEPGEIITAVEFPKPEKAAYAKFPHPASRFSLTGVFVAKLSDGVRVAATGAGPCVFRVKALEDALAKNFSADAVASIKVPATGLNSDIHGSAEYRAHLITVMAKRAVAACR